MRIYSTFFYFLLCMTIMTEGLSQEISLIPAEEHIKTLKTGTLLVKLNTQSRRINARIKAGKNEKAEKLRKVVKKEHDEIMAAFEKHYEFSDYYFFYSDDSDAIIVDKDYSLLFRGAEDIGEVSDRISTNDIYLMLLGTPPGYPSVDKYHFLLSHLSKEGRQLISKPMPRTFSTKSTKWFSNKYDFDRSVRRMNERLNKFSNK